MQNKKSLIHEPVKGSTGFKDQEMEICYRFILLTNSTNKKITNTTILIGFRHTQSVCIE